VQLYGWHEYGNYLGWFGPILAFGSAVWLLVFRRGPAHWREAAAALGLLLAFALAAGEFAAYAPASLLREVPLISNFRIPSRYTLLVPFAGALCAAFAARAFEEQHGPVAWRRAVEVLCIVGLVQLGVVNREHLRDVFILNADGQSQLFDRVTPRVAEQELITPGGPRVHRTFMFDSMLAGVSPLNCYEPLQVRKVASAGPVAITGTGDVIVSASSFSPNRVTATVQVGRDPARVLLNQNFAEGWTANVGTVERDPKTQLPSVVLPPGYSGAVSFTFMPPGVWLGVVVSLVALGASVALWRTSL
jgi:hypothetical protein